MNLKQWLTHIESVHYSEIELGLERITKVFNRLFPTGVPFEVITVGGTNGKGSCCSYLEQIFIESSTSIGKYTSPHISHFNERIAVNGADVSDEQICSAFTQIEAAREDIALTYFEYATLAAIVCFAEQKVEVAVFEIGLGGRLDAVNMLNPQVSVITSIGLDHTDWLGDDLSIIAKEKSAIARRNNPCVVGQSPLPEGMLQELNTIGTKSLIVNRDFTVSKSDKAWSVSAYLEKIDLLTNDVDHQYNNAACAIVAISESTFDIDAKEIKNGIKNAHLNGRCQVVSKTPFIVVDVAHNEDSVKGLRQFIDNEIAKTSFSGRCLAVFSMLSDKDIATSVKEMEPVVDEWHIAEIKDVPRATSIEQLENLLSNVGAKSVLSYDSLSEAFKQVKTTATDNDCILIFGSFHVVGELHDVILRA